MPAKVMLIDDDMWVRSTLQETLLQAGYDVVPFADGRDAVKAIVDTPVDMVITDILMPHLDGVELIRQIRAQSPNVKILAISGGGPNLGMQLLDLAGNLGANRTLPKPFSPIEFVAAVQALVRSA